MADFFLKIDGITGEAQVQDHKDEIEVLSFSYEGSHGTSVSYGQGLSLGSGSVQPFRITKFVDISSAPVFASVRCWQRSGHSHFHSETANHR